MRHQNALRDSTGKIEMIAEDLSAARRGPGSEEVSRTHHRVKVTVDDAGIGLTADGSDFVRCARPSLTKRRPKVLASEYVISKSKAREIIAGPMATPIPVKTNSAPRRHCCALNHAGVIE